MNKKRWVGIIITLLLVVPFAAYAQGQLSLLWTDDCPDLGIGDSEVHISGDTVECYTLATATNTPSGPTNTPTATFTPSPTPTPGDFSPDDLSGLTFWVDADDLFLSDGDPVTLWEDQSANAYDMEQATESRQPEYKTNIVNGEPVVRFDGGDALWESAVSVFDLVGSDAATVYIVISQDGADADNTAFRLKGGNQNHYQAQLTASDNLYYKHGNMSISVGQPTGWDDTFHVVELYRSGSDGEIVVDGSLLLEGTFTDDIDSGSGDWILGANTSTAATGGLTGDIAEVIIYNRALNTTERQSVKDYLDSEY